MSRPVPDVITRYFDADAHRDIDGVVELFADDAVVVDESQTWRGTSRIRAWREGPASQHQYTTELFRPDSTGEDECLITGRLTGDRIRLLHIAP